MHARVRRGGDDHLRHTDVAQSPDVRQRFGTRLHDQAELMQIFPGVCVLVETITKSTIVNASPTGVREKSPENARRRWRFSFVVEGPLSSAKDDTRREATHITPANT